ncbi:MAG: TIGR00296 family protein [Thaumarchaeota archaeon]|nr:TIGR00296 family protein [Nitrososphaerota archaeon]MDE1817358.1 TIGR00296 family protein [Nitrososphaerota archaeon]MDE1875678.1 TIGR00296 family protein [Nitrososphaerota archaeon]
MNISDEDGQILVKTARLVVTEYLKEGKKVELSKEIKSKFSYKSGVFVTLDKKENLRGCIGFPMPDGILHQSLIDAAIASSTEDPRFSPVRLEELNEITFEVTILTPPVEIKVKDTSEYPKMVKVGRDGLIMRWEFGSGLLLPQVPIEYGWNSEEFLGHACEKAGAPSNYWKQKSVKILKFEGIVFKETEPNGQVKRLEL